MSHYFIRLLPGKTSEGSAGKIFHHKNPNTTLYGIHLPLSISSQAELLIKTGTLN